jgi:hypothetical protein
MLRAPHDFINQVLWPEFTELQAELHTYLHEVTLRIIREQVHHDASDASEVAQALPAR